MLKNWKLRQEIVEDSRKFKTMDNGKMEKKSG